MFLALDYRLQADNMPQEFFLSLGRCELHIDHYPVSEPRGIVIALHGVGGNGRLLSPMLLPLVRAGYEVICPDLPPYGYTRCSGTARYSDWVELGAALLRHYKEKGLPVYLFGLSAGGMLAYQIACEETPAGIMVSCLLDQHIGQVRRETARNSLLARAGLPLLNAFQKVCPSLEFPMKWVADMGHIANDPELVSLLLQDRKSSGARVSVGFLDSYLHPEIPIEPEAFTVCPLLLAHPEQDRWTNLGLSKLFFDRLACPKKLTILPGAGHFPVEEQGLNALAEACLAFLRGGF